MMKAIDMMRKYVLQCASQEQSQIPGYADDVINGMTNVELIETMEQAAEWEESLSPEQIEDLEA